MAVELIIGLGLMDMTSLFNSSGYMIEVDSWSAVTTADAAL
jgi:hypothetical protein